MIRRAVTAGLFAVAVMVAAVLGSSSAVEAAPPGQPANWGRFYHYPYVYYPHNYQQNPNQSYDNLYYRYPQSRQIPVYNKDWYNFYPSEKPYHKGHHYILDVF